MKLIFLDIDGVLNNARWASTWNFLWGGNGYGGFDKHKIDRRTVKWDPYNVRALKHIMNQTGAKIVISSTWRHSHSINNFKTMFQLYGLKPGRIVGITPKSNIRYPYSDSYMATDFRGDEVNAFMSQTELPMDNYVILDDNSDFYPGQKLVQTDSEVGLTDDDAIRAIKILNGGGRLIG